MDRRSGVVFITGGARSGKSAFALKEAAKRGHKRIYVASAEPLDEEMKERIQRHRGDRGAGWKTIEEPIDIAGVLKGLRDDYDVVLIDCMTLWLSNIMTKSEKDRTYRLDRMIDDFTRALKQCGRDMRVFVVSNEVGLGIVPENDLARAFRDIAGKANQDVADIADEVYLVISGIPVKIK